MCDTWKLRFKNDLEPFEAEYNPYFDDNSKEIPTQPKYVRLTTKDSGVCLKLKRKDSGAGCEIFVNKKSTKLADGTDGIKFIECEESEYYYYTLRKNEVQKWAFRGMIVGIIGLAIDASFDLGKIYAPFGHWDAIYIFWAKTVSWVLKIGGLFLVFWKGLTTGK